MRSLVTLRTPPVARLAPDGVFDDFAWCASDRLDWARDARRPFDAAATITPANPPAMVFVLRAACAFLPKESAALHVPGIARDDEECLAPWAIDDATDELWAHRARPGDLLWLAASGIDALFWGLHDWAHFHSHGPFDRRAWTELQCDATALAWTWINRDAIGIDDAAWERARREVIAIGAARFADEAEAWDASLLDAERLRRLV